ASAAPAASKAKASASCEYRGYREASAPAVYASRAMLPPPLQDSLPAGWLASTGWASNSRESFTRCYPLSFRGQVCEAQDPLLFPDNGPPLATPPFPRSGPGEPSSPTSSVLWRRYDFPVTYPQSLICFASRAHAYLRDSCLAACAPRGVEDAFRARILVQPVIRFPVFSHVDVPGYLRFPGNPSYAFASFHAPGRTDDPSPLVVSPVLPLLNRQQRLQRDNHIGASAGL